MSAAGIARSAFNGLKTFSARLAWLLAACLCGGCAATHFENAPLATSQPNVERRSFDLSNPDRPLVLVAISGGGSRAAALGWSVLSELRDQKVTTGGAPHSLADDVAVVSSVSGGSVIAADFVLNGKQGLEDFRNSFLAPDNMELLKADFLDPFSLLANALFGKSRTSAIEAMFDRELFHGRTFAEVNQPGKPYLILNATDMASGERFAFTPQRFDDICADLDLQTLSSGVAASSAVPIVVAPVALRNHAGPDCPAQPASNWPEQELAKRFSPYLNLEAYKRARYAVALRRSNDPAGGDAARSEPYLYLLDGGLVDNFGIQALMEVLSTPQGARVVADPHSPAPASVLAAINGGAVRRLVVIVINARAQPANDLARQPSRPGLGAMAGAVASQPIDSATASLSAQMAALMAQFNAASGGGTGDPLFKGLRTYSILVDFDQLPVNTAEGRALQEKVKNVPTSWRITADNLAAVQQAGTTLLRRHPCYQRLLLDVAADAPFVDAAWAKTGCRMVGD